MSPREESGHNKGGLRRLAACPACARQFDTSALNPGDKFRCTCGQIIPVDSVKPHEAAVTRCSSCGGPREMSASACRYCGADFSLHERDLHTICPKCAARVSDRSRYCHHCAAPILPEGDAGEPTQSPCPACAESGLLNSRRVGAGDVSALECPRCAGLWLSKEAFGVVSERARREAEPDPGYFPAPTMPMSRDDESPRPVVRYRPCPTCGKLMNRQNFGRKSGVILDSCNQHGVWFDPNELEGVLRWIRQGGESVAKRFKEEQKQSANQQARVEAWKHLNEPGHDSNPARVFSFLDLLATLFRFLVRD